MHRRFAFTALAAIALLGLTACDAPSTPNSAATSASQDAQGDEGQTTEQACTLIRDTISDATSSFEATTDSDPQAVVDAMRAAVDTLSGVSSQVTNDDVAELLPSLVDMFTQTADVMEAITTGDTEALGDLAALGDEFEKTTKRFQELCVSS